MPDNYNGWKNWESWNTYNWISQDPGWYREAAKYRTADDLSNWVEDFFGPINNTSGLIMDAWTAFLHEVDWDELVEVISGDGM